MVSVRDFGFGGYGMTGLGAWGPAGAAAASGAFPGATEDAYASQYAFGATYAGSTGLSPALLGFLAARCAGLGSAGAGACFPGAQASGAGDLAQAEQLSALLFQLVAALADVQQSQARAGGRDLGTLGAPAAGPGSAGPSLTAGAGGAPSVGRRATSAPTPARPRAMAVGADGAAARPPVGRGSAGAFLQAALAQKGDRYVYGAETNLNDKNPTTFDCSELVQWAAAQAGVRIPDGSGYQKAYCRQHNKTISVDEAIRTPGALLFKEGHVAISLGDGRTIEAMGSKWGVCIGRATGRFTSGGLVPGLSY